MNPSVSAQTVKTGDPALHAGVRKAKSSSPCSPPRVLVPEWTWAVHPRPDHAGHTAVFREPDDFATVSRSNHLWKADGMETSNTKDKGRDMSIWIILAVIVVWVLLQAYILPKMGIST